MATVLRRLQLRIERSCERMGASYPWWIPTFSTLSAVAIELAAWLQRGGVGAPLAVHLALALAVYPFLVWIPWAWMTPPWLEAGTAVAAVALYLTDPVSPDLAPLLFLMAAGEVAAVSRTWVGCLVATLDVTVLVTAGALGRLDSAGIYAVGTVLAASVGVALRWQMRAIQAEQTNALFAQERAISAERQRLAREVHDVVGHTLSINLLHVTAARHALQQHADIADAIDCLIEAERVGRDAMGDLRRTVAVLAAAPGTVQPLPGADDIADLVARSREAGLDVTYACEGDPARLGPAAGLGLFRIVQESLGNVARHAPGTAAVVRVRDDGDRLRLTVSNPLPAGSPAAATGGGTGGGTGGRTGGGTGLPGMAARAEQLGAHLRAGPDGEQWLVQLTVPAPRTATGRVLR